MNKAKQLKKDNARKDREWRKELIKQEGAKCTICGDTNRPNAHHIIPKTFKETRHDVQNGVMLCPKHHKYGKFSAHKNALWFINLLQDCDGDKHNYLLKKLKEIDGDNN